MFEKDAGFAETKMLINCNGDYSKKQDYKKGWQEGAEFGYNKAKEEARLKLKDEGIIKSLKGSILRNERLSNQEQQELCAWIECAMDFGENLDECAKELEEANKANEWHYVKDGLPTNTGLYLIFYYNSFFNDKVRCIARYSPDRKEFLNLNIGDGDEVIAWLELPALPKESE